MNSEMDDLKRLFFGFEVAAPWPEQWPVGRLLKDGQRHMTIAFLGQADSSILLNALSQFPSPSFKVGLTGRFDECLFLPERHPRVVAWHIDWLGDEALISAYQKKFNGWLSSIGFHIREHEAFLPHVTLCRSPFISKDWKKAFTKLPMYINGLHLYESKGSLTYEPLWSYPLLPPFEEIEHTADIAFLVRAENIQQLYNNATIALAFRFPRLLNYDIRTEHITDIDDIVIALNSLVTQADAEAGCPYKAVSFHGDLIQNAEYLSWEMIVDV